MPAPRLAAIDAQSFWLSAKIPNDTVLVFGFAGVPADLEAALTEVKRRASEVAELAVRIDDANPLRYPRWAPCGVDDSQCVVHELDVAHWDRCMERVDVLTRDALDVRHRAWRLHVFPSVAGVPGIDGTGTVAVLQISHALGGGGRTAQSAALMFGRVGELAEVTPWRTHPASLPVLGWRAARAHRALLADADAGVVPPAAPSRPAALTNARPAGATGMRAIALKRAELSGPTVTVGALSVISEALAQTLRRRGQDTSTLGAELMMAKPPPRRSYNHFGAVGVGLYPELGRDERMARISADIDARRQRAAHPAMLAAERAFAATPAPLLRWGISKFDPTVRLDHVTGNTVVSSVNGGAADYAFGGAPIAMLAALPGLSPMMGLTHCVCGIGDTVTIGLNAVASVLDETPDAIDQYVDRIVAALAA